jgi:hypothetical protein
MGDGRKYGVSSANAGQALCVGPTAKPQRSACGIVILHYLSQNGGFPQIKRLLSAAGILKMDIEALTNALGSTGMGLVSRPK